MFEFKRVLCPIDLSELSDRPLAYAGAFARWYDARLTVLHVVPTFEPLEVRAGALFDPVRVVYPVSRDEVVQQLRQSAAEALPDLDVGLAAEAGDAVPTIVDQAINLHADLVVMGTHGRSGFDRLLLGSVAERVLRKAPCPVLTVPPHAPALRAREVAIAEVLCAFDFSASAMQALGFALDIARRADASVTLLHVIEWLAEDEPREIAHFSVPEYRDHLINDALERMNALLAQEGPVRRGAVPMVVVGRAHRHILQTAADKAAGLIVMGAQGRGGAALTVFGSTTEQVVRGANCPVLTVRKPIDVA